MIKRVLRKLSAKIAGRPAAFTGSQSRLFANAWKALDLDAASWAVRRINWLRDTARDHSAFPLEPESIQAPLASEMAARVQAAYARRVDATECADEDIWGSLRNSHLAIIPAALNAPDHTRVAELAARIFRTSAVNGFSYGTTFNRWPHRWSYLPMMIELSVVTLAEALGVVRLENPEQSVIAGWREQTDAAILMGVLEDRLGFRIEHARAGNPRGIVFGGRFLTRETCSQIYTAHRLDEAVRRAGLTGPVNIVEIGGGYGGLAYWLRKVMGSRLGRHAIIDLAEVSAIQAMFLLQTIEEGIVLPGETPSAAGVQLVLNTAMEQLDFAPDLVVNQDSMPEMPLAVAENYLDWIAGSGAALFASFNHEAYASNSPGEAQGWISQMAGVRPAYRRLSRELSWDRPGYVEEIYCLDAAQGKGVDWV